MNEPDFLARILFFDDREPRSAAGNMAVDETLLRAARQPVLRVYRWARPAVSFGYFEKWAPVRAAWPEREMVRRWTGGGVVAHGEDWTYSLLVPRGFPQAEMEAGECYRRVHEILARALAGHGIGASCFPENEAKISAACFQNPVRHDVSLAGKKIAGAAQRRTRFGLLHQGSVQGVALPEGFGASLAAALARETEPWAMDGFSEALDLAQAKYASRDWLEKY